MPKSKYNWTEELNHYIAMKTSDPKLTNEEFYKRRGIGVHVGRRKLGRKMGETWARIQEKTIKAIEKEGAINLKKEVRELFRLNKAMLVMGASNIMPKGEAGKATFKAGNFKEALKMFEGGTKGIVKATNLITGGEPLEQGEARQVEIDFFPHSEK